MPRIDEPVKISRTPGFLIPRTPFFRHVFVGGNTFVQEMLRENSEEKSRAYKQLETANLKLESANCRLEENSKNLEIKVEERTAELAALNRNLQESVDAKVEEIKRYNEWCLDF